MSPENWPFDSKGNHGDPALGHSDEIAPKVGEYPKWITPHDSHVERTADNRPIVTTHENHIARKGVLMVLVMDEEDEKTISAPKSEEKA